MKEVTVQMLCDLDEVELAAVAQRLGLTIFEIQKVEKEKAEASKGFREELSALHETARDLSKVLRDRSEVRPVDCYVEFHKPVQGTKRLVRKDTGELYRDEPMSALECQQNLFEEDANG